MAFNLETLVRDNIKQMIPYSSARHEYNSTAKIFLDANENSFGSPLPVNYNRYPDPMQLQIKKKLSKLNKVPVNKIFLGNGSDEAIDILFRIFCEPGYSNVIICPPTYGMYEVCGAVNNTGIKKISLTNEFQLNPAMILRAIDVFTKIIFICSPNNPTGNSINQKDIETVLNNFDGLVVIDEAYINYTSQSSFIPELSKYPNLIVLQTFSKAWGLAGLRLGMAFAGAPIVDHMNKVKYPYNINIVTQQLALDALENINSINNWIKATIEQRELLKKELAALPFVQIIYPSDANFILVKVKGARKIYAFLSGKGIIVRDCSRIMFCEGCLRITIGTPEENKQLIESFKEYNA
jgi:histidinol-phosphate aminotransferase